MSSLALWIGTSFAIFNSWGKTPNDKERLQICFRGIHTIFLMCFNVIPASSTFFKTTKNFTYLIFHNWVKIKSINSIVWNVIWWFLTWWWDRLAYHITIINNTSIAMKFFHGSLYFRLLMTDLIIYHDFLIFDLCSISKSWWCFLSADRISWFNLFLYFL